LAAAAPVLQRTAIRKRNRKLPAPRRRRTPDAFVTDAAAANRLALIRAFCASPEPSTRPQSRPVHNFFRAAKAVAPGVFAAAKACASDACAAPRDFVRKKNEATKTHISSAFLSRAIILRKKRAGAEIFLPASRRRSLRASRTTRRGGAYTQN
jgi:hypothetical protein